METKRPNNRAVIYSRSSYLKKKMKVKAVRNKLRFVSVFVNFMALKLSVIIMIRICLKQILLIGRVCS